MPLAPPLGALPSLVRIAPLGGLGEVGMNCLVIEQGGAEPGDEVARLVIDCGATFPSSPHGVDVLHPRFDHLLGEPEALCGVVITHGHEDHIGALSYLLEELEDAGLRKIDVWGPPYGLALLRRQLDEAGIAVGEPHAATDEGGETLVARLIELRPRQRTPIGPFVVEPLRVTHSIPDALALAIDTAAGTIVHTGDFKLDPDPTDAEKVDEERLSELGDAGVALLLSDSTNSLEEGSAGGERAVAATLAELVGEATERVVVGSFASNVHRLGAIAAAARAHGRRLCLLGRSMHNHAAVAGELGRLRLDDLLIAPPQAAKLPRGAVIYAATGTQGEPRGALRRLASGQHADLRLEPGDTVLMSSRIIPGCERAVHAMLDDLIAAGVRVRTRATDRGIHVSGHAHAAEQRRLIELVRPRAFIPVHGTRMLLGRHAERAKELGVVEVEVLVNGETAELGPPGSAPTGLRRGERVVSGQVARAWGRVIDEEVLRQRRQLGREGLIMVAAVQHAGRTTGLSVRTFGVPLADEVVRLAERAARAALLDAARRDGLDPAERVRRSVRQRVRELLGQRPIVEVSISE